MKVDLQFGLLFQTRRAVRGERNARCTAGHYTKPDVKKKVENSLTSQRRTNILPAGLAGVTIPGAGVAGAAAEAEEEEDEADAGAEAAAAEAGASAGAAASTGADSSTSFKVDALRLRVDAGVLVAVLLELAAAVLPAAAAFSAAAADVERVERVLRRGVGVDIYECGR
jgi:hypothetical protein